MIEFVKWVNKAIEIQLPIQLKLRCENWKFDCQLLQTNFEP